MKRFLILCILVFLLTAAGIIVMQNGTEHSDKPVSQAVVVSGLVPEKLQLGYIESGSVHDVIFTISNASEQDKSIDAVEIECNCITVSDTSKIIPAKSSLPIHLQFTAPEATGPYTKTITVKSGSDVWQSRLYARINAPLRIEPKELVFSAQENNTEQQFTVFNEGTQPIQILYATAIPALCSVKTPAEPIAPQSHTVLIVSLNDPISNRLITLNLHTDHRFQKMISIPVRVK